MSPLLQLLSPRVPSPHRRVPPVALGATGRLATTAAAVTLVTTLTVTLVACGGQARDAAPANDTASPSAASPSATAEPGHTAETAAAPQLQLPPTGGSAQPGSPPLPGAGARLTPLADTIAQRLVFAPLVQDWFVAAARNKRLVVDLGRVDIDLKKDPARIASFAQAARAISPFPKGTVFALNGPWGGAEASVADFEEYNGRIVGVLSGAPLYDSLARSVDPLVVAARRGVASGDSAVTAPAATGADTARASSSPPPCDRTVDSAFVARLRQVAREAEDSLRASEDQPLYERLKKSVKARRSLVQGCFGAARGLVIVTWYAGDYEWVREKVLLVGEGTPKKATIRDLRFRAHEALVALDANGDGIDDLAARAWTPRGGGTAILTFTPGTSRFERLAQGFAWER